jgi:hypothetical protein
MVTIAALKNQGVLFRDFLEVFSLKSVKTAFSLYCCAGSITNLVRVLQYCTLCSRHRVGGQANFWGAVTRLDVMSVYNLFSHVF